MHRLFIVFFKLECSFHLMKLALLATMNVIYLEKTLCDFNVEQCKMSLKRFTNRTIKIMHWMIPSSAVDVSVHVTTPENAILIDRSLNWNLICAITFPLP